MAESWILNASPLIALDLVGCIDVLAGLAGDVVIPDAVLAEVAAGPNPLSPAVLGHHRVVSGLPTHPIVAAWDLGKGENAVLSTAAANPGSIAIVDDLAARRCGATLGIETRGTLRVLIDAKKAGLIPAVKPLIDKMQVGNIFLSSALIAQVLMTAGEADS